MTAAAKQLHLSQSALSHSVRKLEQQLGTALWQKEGRQVRFTQAGEHLLSVAERVLPQLEHADALLREFARGSRGFLRVGMECHPCYRWLLNVVEPFLRAWPDVEVDVKQEFQFGGMAALFNYDIDMLVTPDPLFRPGVQFVPVFDYEMVLAVTSTHPLGALDRPLIAEDLQSECLLTYPVATERLDIYTELLSPARILPARRKTIEATDIMLQLVAAGRGVAALPQWLVEEYSQSLPLKACRLGSSGIHKHIYLGVREGEQDVAYIDAFIQLAAQH